MYHYYIPASISHHSNSVLTSLCPISWTGPCFGIEFPHGCHLYGGASPSDGSIDCIDAPPWDSATGVFARSPVSHSQCNSQIPMYRTFATTSTQQVAQFLFLPRRILRQHLPRLQQAPQLTKLCRWSLRWQQRRRSWLRQNRLSELVRLSCWCLMWYQLDHPQLRRQAWKPTLWSPRRWLWNLKRSTRQDRC